MTARTGVINRYGTNGEVGRMSLAVGIFDLSTVTFATTDVITWTNILPNGRFIVRDFHLNFREIDTHATAPTGIFTAGNSDDADGYVITGNLGVIPAQAPTGSAETGLPMNFHGDGALITGTTPFSATTVLTNRSVTMTVTAAIATVATSGLIVLRIWTEAAA